MFTCSWVPLVEDMVQCAQLEHAIGVIHPARRWGDVEHGMLSHGLSFCEGQVHVDGRVVDLSQKSTVACKGDRHNPFGAGRIVLRACDAVHNAGACGCCARKFQSRAAGADQEQVCIEMIRNVLAPFPTAKRCTQVVWRWAIAGSLRLYLNGCI